MKNRLNSWLKAFLTLNKSEQRGIIILLVIIIIIVIINLLLPYIFESRLDSKKIVYDTEIQNFLDNQQDIKDSIRIEKLQNTGKMDYDIASTKLTPFEFNPNNLPEDAWKKLGFTDRQIKNIKNYEAAGGKFNRKEDLKKIYSISDVEYSILEPYIIISSPYKSKKGKIIKKKTNIKKLSLVDIEINSADSLQLLSSLGLSPWLARRIISYKSLLGGYTIVSQLKEVYGLTDSIFNCIENHILIDTSLVKKIDLNNVKFKELLIHPYFDYNTTKSIINTRQKVGKFTNLDQLKMIETINDSILNKVSYYLYIRP